MAKETTIAREGGVNPLNGTNNSSYVARQQTSARQEITDASIDEKIRQVASREYGARVILGDLERAKTRIEGDAWYDRAKELQERVKKQSNVDEDKLPAREAGRRAVERNQYREAVRIWNEYRNRSDYKNAKKAVERLRKAGFTAREIQYYANR